jgi:hypothetical protein
MLPNPVYGGWQRALPEAEKALKAKLEKPDGEPIEGSSEEDKGATDEAGSDEADSNAAKTDSESDK